MKINDLQYDGLQQMLIKMILDDELALIGIVFMRIVKTLLQ